MIMQNNKSLVGKVIYNSWGYEQTNVDFYQIIKETDKQVVVRQLKQETTESGFMSGTAVPLIDQFKSEETYRAKKAKGYEDRLSFRSSLDHSSVQYMYLWDGKPERVSWYG